MIPALLLHMYGFQEWQNDPQQESYSKEVDIRGKSKKTPWSQTSGHLFGRAYMHVHERIDDDGNEEVEEDEDHEDDVEEPEDECCNVDPPLEVEDGVEGSIVVEEHHEARDHGLAKGGKLQQQQQQQGWVGKRGLVQGKGFGGSRFAMCSSIQEWRGAWAKQCALWRLHYGFHSMDHRNCLVLLIILNITVALSALVLQIHRS